MTGEEMRTLSSIRAEDRAVLVAFAEAKSELQQIEAQLDRARREVERQVERREKARAAYEVAHKALIGAFM